jgi:isopenicillin-N epimerase
MTESVLDRRGFLKLAGAAGLGLAADAAGLRPKPAATPPTLVAESHLFTPPGSGNDALPHKAVLSQSQEDLERFLASEEPYFMEFAKTLLLDPATPYFAAGQKGSQPIPILNRFKEGLDQIAKDPFPVYLEPSATTRQKIAKSYGATVDEIAISRNTTDAISMILHGIDWQNGDELLASTMEYPNCVATMLRIAGRFGVKIRQFGLPIAHSATADEILASIQRQIRPGKTKVLFFSCPIQPAGIMMPTRRIAQLAQQHGIITIVDGAHYGGQFVPKLDEMGIDFWGISGHKWQCGPGGTGILYTRNRPHAANSTPLPRFYLVRSGDLHAPTDGSRPADFDIGAALSLYGFPESADWRALGEVCVLWDSLGRQRIENYILALGEYFRRRLIKAFGETALLQPLYDPELKSGIIAFNPFPKPEQRRSTKICGEFRDRMFKEYRYHTGGEGLGPLGLTRPPDPEAAMFPTGCIPNRDAVTNAPAPTDYPMRVNACMWNNRSQIDRFVAACQELVEKTKATSSSPDA